MTHQVLVGLAAVIVFGTLAQWLAWRLRLPSILLLLIFGFLAGPITGFLDPDELLGDLLLPFVSLSVAVILFEGGLSLRLEDLRQIGRGLSNLITLGALVTWVLTALAAVTILDFSFPVAVLLGAILIVTGPTVVFPLLRHVRPRGQVASLVKWEGILNDPIGAVLAVLVFEVMLAGGWGAGSSIALTGFLKTVGGGIFIGTAGALIMVFLIRFYHIPDYLENPFALMMVVVVYTVSDLLQPESGLLSTTLMGIVMANQKMVPVKHIVEFKENLRVLLISSLFIFLAARLDVESLRLLGWGSSIVFLGALILVIRPVSVFLSGFGSGLTWKEKAFVSWMAPRGIVAAAVTSVFALRLEEAGYSEAGTLVPVVFVVIVGTVLVYGLSSAPVARWLGVAGGASQGCLLVGAHGWAQEIGKALQNAGIPVLLVDNNRSYITAAKLAGLPAYFGNILDDSLPEHIPLEGLGKLIAMTSNHEVNSLAALHFIEEFGRQDVFQVIAHEENAQTRERYSLSPHLRGRLLFGQDHRYTTLDRRFSRGGIVKTTKLSEDFDYEAFQTEYGGTAVLLFIIEGSSLKPATVRDTPDPKPGQTVIALVDPVTSKGAVAGGDSVPPRK